MRSLKGYAIAFGLAASAGIWHVSDFSNDMTDANKSLVSCGADEICRPRGLHSTTMLEKDPTVLRYAQEGKCDKMQGNAQLACMNAAM